jgi:hypothetical protein
MYRHAFPLVTPPATAGEVSVFATQPVPFTCCGVDCPNAGRVKPVTSRKAKTNPILRLFITFSLIDMSPNRFLELVLHLPVSPLTLAALLTASVSTCGKLREN